MNDVMLNAIDRLLSMWRLRWWSVAVAWAICAIGWFWVLAMPNVYQSSARVFVDTRTALKPILQGIGVEQDVGAEVSRVEQALLSRPQLEQVARAVGLDARVKRPEDMDDVVLALRTSLSIEVSQNRDGGDNLYSIMYRDADRDRSLAVVRTLLDSFIGDTLGSSQAGSESGQKFLREQIDVYEGRLSEVEARLAEFKRDNEGLIPGQKGDYFSRLSAAIDANQKSRTELGVATSRRNELERQLEAAAPFIPGASGATGPGGMAPDLPSRIQESEAQLQELLLRYTEKHPEVLALRDTIAELKRQQALELSAIAKGRPGTGAIRSLSANPVHQNVMLQLNQTDVEIAALRGAVQQHEQEIARLRTFVDTAPDVEQRFASLNRDYEVTKLQYSALVERLEKARISENADRTSIVRFRVIDPPMATMDPVAPNRPVLILAVLVAGLAGGVLVAFLAQQLKPVFESVLSLRRATGLPVLGAISAVLTERDAAAQTREMRWLAGTCAALLVTTLLLVTAQGRVADAVHTLLRFGTQS